MDFAEAWDYGCDKIKEVVKLILKRGHDIGVHIHPDHMLDTDRAFLWQYSESEQRIIIKRMVKPEHDAELADKIKECQNRTDRTYGYRRVWKWLPSRNIQRNPKTVHRVMKKYGL